MKLTLTISTWLLAVCSYAQTHSITLGKGENCTGYNICALKPYSKESVPEKNECPVYIALNKDSRIVFSFPKSKVNDAVFLKHFATGYLVLDADYPLPESLAKALRQPLLRMGKYKIVATADSYEIVF